MTEVNTTVKLKCPMCGHEWTHDLLPRDKPHVISCVYGAKGCGAWFAAQMQLVPRVAIFRLVGESAT